MSTKTQMNQSMGRKTSVERHRLGMGWHFVCRYDPPIVHHLQRDDGTSYDWEEEGETSEGCIMWLADQFCRQVLGGITARDVYRLAYRDRDGDGFDDEWLHTDALRDVWAEYTVLPKRWTPTAARKLFEDLEDVNYHSFLAKLLELVEERAPTFARSVSAWCVEVPR